MRRAVDLIEEGVMELATTTMVLVHRGTIQPSGASPGTPVRTGKHASAGRVASGSPPTHVPPKDPPFSPMGESEAAQALSGARLGDPLFWASRAPVPALLEDGLSPKAPEGFLQLSTDEAVRQVEAMEVL